MELIIYPDATETLQMDVVVNIGATGEPYNQHSTTCSNETKSVTTNNFTKWELSTLTGSPFTSMTAGDIVSISITSDTTLSRVVGILFKYS
jgi:short-subunit dehydrogenase